MFFMRKTFWLILAGLAVLKPPGCLHAQESQFETQFEAKLESVLVLNIKPETLIEFGVKKVNDNLYQISKPPEDVYFSVESTSNWNLSISTEGDFFKGKKDSTQKIPVEFLGYSIENRGDNWDNGLFSNITNKAKDTVISLSPNENMVLVNGSRNNIGGSAENAFILRWQFNFEDEVSKAKRFSRMDVEDDYFTGRFYLTLSECEPVNSSK